MYIFFDLGTTRNLFPWGVYAMFDNHTSNCIFYDYMIHYDNLLGFQNPFTFCCLNGTTIYIEKIKSIKYAIKKCNKISTSVEKGIHTQK